MNKELPVEEQLNQALEDLSAASMSLGARSMTGQKTQRALNHLKKCGIEYYRVAMIASILNLKLDKTPTE